MSVAMNQAQRIIEKCGGGDAGRGVAIVAEITGIHRSRIWRWTYPKERGGTGGTIPSNHQQEILVRARERGIDLTPEDFFEPLHAAGSVLLSGEAAP